MCTSAGFVEKTGFDCAKYLVEHADVWPTAVIVHSWNPVGAQNIANLLKDYTKVYIDPFPIRIIV
jgi:hypothetical protein